MSLILFLHNLNRWIVLLLLLTALGRAGRSLAQKRPWQAADTRLGLFLTIALDTQLLLGLLLYFFFSSLTQDIWQHFGAAMAQPATRFFALEHVLYGLVAVVLAHVGRARTKRPAADAVRQRAALIFYGLTLAALLAGIPWFRPLLPHL